MSTVSVIIPTRDRPQLLERAVRSVLSQRFSGHIELIIVFDQSEVTDTERYPASATRAVRGITNVRSQGAGGARNTGILAATGELIAFCDDDDEWLPTKLEQQLKVVAQEPQTPAVGCGVDVLTPGRTKRHLPREWTHYQDLLRSRCMELNPCTMLAPRRTFDVVGLFDEAIPGGSAEDYDWFLRAAKLHPIRSVRETLVRVHWDRTSWFAFRWKALAQSLEYLIAKHPEFETNPAGFARLAGQIAMAHAGAAEHAEARRWAARALRASPLEPRAWLAMLASHRVLSVERVVDITTRLGRGLI